MHPPQPPRHFLASGLEVGGGRFRLERLLGEGGTASVWLAQRTDLPRVEAALKFIDAKDATKSEQAEQLRREAQRLFKLNHSNVVAVRDFVIDESLALAFLVMDYIPGRSLKERLHLLAPQGQSGSGRMTPRDVLAWLKPLADGIDHVHERGIVHRDIKPGNIVFDEKESPFLVDFGIASFDSSRTMGSPTTSGTLPYMGPERFLHRSNAASDVYSLAATVYECLAGTPPFIAGETDRLIDVIFKAPVPAIPGLSPAVNGVLSKGLSKEPELRHAKASEFALDFANALTQPDGQDTRPQAMGTSQGTRPRARWRLAVGGLVVLGVAGAALGVLRPWRWVTPTTPEQQQAAEANRQSGSSTAAPTQLASDANSPPKTPAQPSAENKVSSESRPASTRSSEAQPPRAPAHVRPDALTEETLKRTRERVPLHQVKVEWVDSARARVRVSGPLMSQTEMDRAKERLADLAHPLTIQFTVDADAVVRALRELAVEKNVPSPSVDKRRRASGEWYLMLRYERTDEASERAARDAAESVVLDHGLVQVVGDRAKVAEPPPKPAAEPASQGSQPNTKINPERPNPDEAPKVGRPLLRVTMVRPEKSTACQEVPIDVEVTNLGDIQSDDFTIEITVMNSEADGLRWERNDNNTVECTLSGYYRVCTVTAVPAGKSVRVRAWAKPRPDATRLWMMARARYERQSSVESTEFNCPTRSTEIVPSQPATLEPVFGVPSQPGLPAVVSLKLRNSSQRPLQAWTVTCTLPDKALVSRISDGGVIDGRNVVWRQPATAGPLAADATLNLRFDVEPLPAGNRFAFKVGDACEQNLGEATLTTK